MGEWEGVSHLMIQKNPAKNQTKTKLLCQELLPEQCEHQSEHKCVFLNAVQTTCPPRSAGLDNKSDIEYLSAFLLGGILISC